MDYATLHGADGLVSRDWGNRGSDTDEEGQLAMHSRIVAVAARVAIALLGSAGAVAQDATPEAAPAGESLFADLGLPELTVTATDEGFELSESEVEAGRYLVHFVNETDNPEIGAGFVRLVEGKTLDDLSFADEMASGTPAPEEMPDVESFAWLYDTYIAGGVSAPSDQAVIDLRGGEYGVWADDPASSIAAAPLTVTWPSMPMFHSPIRAATHADNAAIRSVNASARFGSTLPSPSHSASICVKRGKNCCSLSSSDAAKNAVEASHQPSAADVPVTTGPPSPSSGEGP